MKNRLKSILQQYNVNHITFDSRKIKTGDAFFAIRGLKFDGNNYIDQALKSGASIVITDQVQHATKHNIIYFDNVRQALEITAEILYPNSPENIITVTGTNGKTSVVYYIYQILDLLGLPCASLGTLGVVSNRTLGTVNNDLNGMTTTDSLSLRKTLDVLYQAKINYIAMEASSHGIHQYRLGNIKSITAAFVSFSQDHLDYHKTMKSYLDAKLQMFSKYLMKNGRAVINSDMTDVEYIKKYLQNYNIPYITIGTKGDIKIINNSSSIYGQEAECLFDNIKYSFKTNIIGYFQLTNILIALQLVQNLNLPNVTLQNLVDIIPLLKAPKGRLERITKLSSSYHIFIDYAHTPDGLHKVLLELSKIKQSPGRLFVVFGCGGNRDKAKRPMMGKIASKIADYIVLTDDNPREESPQEIRSQIIQGIDTKQTKASVIEISDRAKAIQNTIAKLKSHDTLLISGKGHEERQVIKEKTTKFSDFEIARDCIGY